ncbi:MAG: hypothetical protein ACLPKB_02915 [Xanthobacteraceae bacterium]
MAYFAKADYDHAIADHTEAIKLDPTNPISYWMRAMNWGNKGEAARRRADLEEGTRLNQLPGPDGGVAGLCNRSSESR